MRKEDKGLVEIEKHLIKEHLAVLLHTLQKYELQDTETYRHLKKWQGLRWEELERIAAFGRRQTPHRSEAEDYHFVQKTYNETQPQIKARVSLLENDIVMQAMSDNFTRMEMLKAILDEAQQPDATRAVVEREYRELKRKHLLLQKRWNIDRGDDFDVWGSSPKR